MSALWPRPYAGAVDYTVKAWHLSAIGGSSFGTAFLTAVISEKTPICMKLDCEGMGTWFMPLTGWEPTCRLLCHRYALNKKLTFNVAPFSLNCVLPPGRGGFAKAKVVATTLQNFMASTDAVISTEHVPSCYPSCDGNFEWIPESEQKVPAFQLQQGLRSKRPNALTQNVLLLSLPSSCLLKTQRRSGEKWRILKRGRNTPITCLMMVRKRQELWVFSEWRPVKMHTLIDRLSEVMAAAGPEALPVWPLRRSLHRWGSGLHPRYVKSLPHASRSRSWWFYRPASVAAILDVLLSQRCGKVLVGDPHQQIYTFKGAINALDIANHTHVFYLTQVRRTPQPAHPSERRRGNVQFILFNYWFRFQWLAKKCFVKKQSIGAKLCWFLQKLHFSASVFNCLVCSFTRMKKIKVVGGKNRPPPLCRKKHRKIIVE